MRSKSTFLPASDQLEARLTHTIMTRLSPVRFYVPTLCKGTKFHSRYYRSLENDVIGPHFRSDQS